MTKWLECTHTLTSPPLLPPVVLYSRYCILFQLKLSNFLVVGTGRCKLPGWLKIMYHPCSTLMNSQFEKEAAGGQSYSIAESDCRLQLNIRLASIKQLAINKLVIYRQYPSPTPPADSIKYVGDRLGLRFRSTLIYQGMAITAVPTRWQNNHQTCLLKQWFV